MSSKTEPEVGFIYRTKPETIKIIKTIIKTEKNDEDEKSEIYYRL